MARIETSPAGNRLLWVIPLFLSIGGVVMIASLTSRSSPETGSLALRQLRFLGLGVFLALTIYHCFSIRALRHLACIFWLFALGITFCTLIPGIGVKVGGARRWLNLGFIQFQPLEILTLAVPLFLADRLAASKREGFNAFLRPTCLLAAFSVLPLFFQPNMGGIILVSAICMSMHVENRGWKWPLFGAVVLAFLFAVMILAEPYRMRRLLAFLDPWEDPLDRGFQIIQGLVAFSNGGLLGVGVGKGLQKLNYLPAAHTDYIFPAIGEEFGLAGTLLIVVLYALWALRIYALYRRSADPFLAVLTWGLAASILFPMFVNLGGVMKLMPLTGIPLPFVSLGGSSLVLMWIKVGVLLRVSKEIMSAAPLAGTPER